MNVQFTEEKLIQVFCETDDICNSYSHWMRLYHPEKLQPFAGGLCPSEMLTILTMYHHSGYKCFEYYYKELVCKKLTSYFPGLVCYKRFLQLIPRCLEYVYITLKIKCLAAESTGIYYVDSKKLPVCDNRRIYAHKVFDGIASRGKTSTGWFFGLKIHLVINHLGEIKNFVLSPGNVSDANENVLKTLFNGLTGTCYGDKGYISKLFESFYQEGLTIITKIRKNMKNSLIEAKHKHFLQKRGLIESVNDLLMTICDIDHTRHRSPVNAYTHTFAALLAYQFLDNKPALILNHFAAKLAA